jgi:aspartate racemase
VLELVMPGIQAVKATRLDEARVHLEAAARALQRRGARAVVLACTEIPLVLDAQGAGLPVVDATAALARRVVTWSLERRAISA